MNSVILNFGANNLNNKNKSKHFKQMITYNVMRVHDIMSLSLRSAID